MPTSERDHAWRILCEADRQKTFAGEGLHESEDLPRQRRLITTLVYGVLRHRGTLDHLIETISGKSLQHVPTDTLNLLRMGFYQALFLTRVPAYAAVDSSVEIANRHLKGRAGTFVNAVLRKLLRTMDTDANDTKDPRRVLRTPDGRDVIFTEAVFPDPEKNPMEYLSAHTAHPAWLLQRWLDRLGREETVRICEADNTPPPLIVRVNRLKTTRDELVQALTREGAEVESGEHESAVVLRRSEGLTTLQAYQKGWFQIQDVTSQKVAGMLGPREGGTYWDVCAAPGGKATHLAELISDRGLVVATDSASRRLIMVVENALRLGHTSIRVVAADGQVPPWRGRFDGILIDAPCTNTGVLARRPEARWRLSPRDLEVMPLLQSALLKRCSEFLRPGGTLVYSTCSIEPEENDRVIAKFLRHASGFRCVHQELTLPSTSHSGGFVAKLKKVGTA